MIELLVLFALLILGIFLLIKGGDYVVEVCSRLASLTGINEVLIGATVISLATTLPELTITVLGMSQNSNDLVVGNAFGTILVNICLVLGLSLCFMSLKRVNRQTQSKLLFMSIMVLILGILTILNFLNVYVGITFIIIFLFYFIKTFNDIKKDLIRKENIDAENPVEKPKATTQEKVISVIKFLVGMLLIFAGAQIVINCSEQISTKLNISASFIGIIFVGIGTSLPELITSIISIKSKRLNFALGNVIGANIINLTLLFGLAMITNNATTIALSLHDIFTMLPAVIISTLILAVPILIKKRTYKWQGYTLISLYAIYCIIIILTL